MATKRITLFNGRPSEMGECLQDAIEWLQDKLKAVPEEFRSAVEVEIEGYDNYGVPSASMAISYLRPETDDERRARQQAEGRRQTEAEAKEVRQLAELVQKHPDVAKRLLDGGSK
jgi:hypothetical protein